MPRPSRHHGLPSPESRVLSPVVHVGYAVPRSGIPAATSFRRWVAAALAGAGHRGQVELAVRIVDREEGRELNRRYLHRDHATNVLSFPAELPPRIDSSLLGDLAICAPVVHAEAVAAGKPIRDHFAHLTVHGVLHLLGHDHQREAAAERMQALETRILAGLGIADPYR